MPPEDRSLDRVAARGSEVCGLRRAPGLRTEDRFRLLALSGEVAGVSSRALVGVDATGWGDFGGAVGAEPDLPAVGGGVSAGFHDAVVVCADQDQVS